MLVRTQRISRLVLIAIIATAAFGSVTARAGMRIKITVRSTADESEQPSYLIVPSDYEQRKDARPLLVSLHSWSGDLEQRNAPLEAEADRRGWLYLFPNFRGRNDDPDACGSKLAQQDILDAVAHLKANYRVDASRIYLTGNSGGGHMTMLMAGRHPEFWTAASAWVGISDLAAWHAKHKTGRYGQMMRQCCGGAPGDSPDVDLEYRNRSPRTFLHRAKDLPLDIAAGIHDGHTGSVPIRHSLEAFNAVAKSGEKLISEQTIQQLSQKRKPSDSADPERLDNAFGREVHFRKQTGPCRVTIFEGGHEGIAKAAAEWLAQHRRPVDR